jgi:hypothetical protein
MLCNECWEVLRKFLDTCNIACDIKVALRKYEGHGEVIIRHAHEPYVLFDTGGSPL